MQSEDFLASGHSHVCFSSLWYAISLTYPVLLLLQLSKSSKSSPVVHWASTPIKKRVVLFLQSIVPSCLLSLSLSLSARIVHERSQWKITSLEEKLHGSCDCFSNFLAGSCVNSDDVSFTFLIHESMMIGVQ